MVRILTGNHLHKNRDIGEKYHLRYYINATETRKSLRQICCLCWHLHWRQIDTMTTIGVRTTVTSRCHGVSNHRLGDCLFSRLCRLTQKAPFRRESAIWRASNAGTIFISWRHPLRWRHKCARWRLNSPASRLFIQSLIQAQMKENIKAPRH